MKLALATATALLAGSVAIAQPASPAAPPPAPEAAPRDRGPMDGPMGERRGPPPEMRGEMPRDMHGDMHGVMRHMRPSKAAVFNFRKGDARVFIKCADDEPTKACIDAASALMDKLAAQPK